MSDTLTTISHFTNSPPGQLAAGGVLAGIVWKFFERVEAVLNEDTKLEIAVWLLGRKKLSPTFQNWPNTFAKVFDRVFGQKHLSWRCFGRSCLATLLSSIFTTVLAVAYVRPRNLLSGHMHETSDWRSILAGGLVAGIMLLPFAYFALLETRFILQMLLRSSSWIIIFALLITDLGITGVSGAPPSYLMNFGLTIHPIASYRQALNSEREFPKWLKTEVERAQAEIDTTYSPDPVRQEEINRKRRETKEALDDIASYEKDLPKVRLFRILALWLPTFFTSIWLWLYAGSGFLLKAARRFDIGFEWFNRHFDIEKRPLQSIGLVAGALVAVVYWAVVIVSRILS